MVAIIFIITIILYAVLISFTWHNLYMLEIKKKIQYILISIVSILVITFVVFNISKIGISYANEDILFNVRTILVLVFTPINGLIVMPYVANMINKIKQKSIKKQESQKKVIRLLIVFIIILILECFYLKDIQEGIIRIFETR